MSTPSTGAAQQAPVRRPAGRDYHDPGVFERERELMFARSWVPVAREEDLAAAGDYVTIDIAGEPVVVTTDRDGVLHGLANVCRHRNAKIVEGSGSMRSLQCPYHRWTYRLDGRLAAAPGFERGDRVLHEICLPRLAVETWLGWVFVNLDPDAASLASQVPGLEARCAPYRLAEMRRVAAFEFHTDWNWKITVENFAESYHHAGVHSATLQPAFPGEQSWADDNQGEPWVNLDHLSTDPDQEPFTASVVFPHHLFSILRPHGLDWMRLEVHDVDDVDITYEIFTLPEHADESATDFLVDAARVINDEDAAINRRTAAGTRSRFATPGPFSHLEAGMSQFRRWWTAQMSR